MRITLDIRNREMASILGNMCSGRSSEALSQPLKSSFRLSGLGICAAVANVPNRSVVASDIIYHDVLAGSTINQNIKRDQSLAASPARLRVSQGRTALRSVAHSAMRPHRGVAPGIPVCPPREHVPPRPLRRIALWSVLRSKTIPPLHPSPASGRAVCLLTSGKPTGKTHTHERGSISSGWPPNQPASRIAKLFGEGGACGVGRSRA